MRPVALFTVFTLLAAAQQPPRFQEPELKLSVTTNLVIVNVDVRGKDGKPVENLTAADFTVTEDGKPQKIAVFEFQRLESEPPAAAAPAPAATAERAAPARVITPSKPGEVRYKDRRLLVLFFDFSSMPQEDQFRAQRSALKFLDTQMTANDMVSIMAFSTKLQVIEDFTNDREKLQATIKGFRIGESSDLADIAPTGEDSTTDTGAAFTADETEFNVFNTDRKLSALESAAKMLSSLPEKKALIYFSSGISQTGMENQSQLRATINAAVRANMSFYPIDARGLVASAPGGNAGTASARGNAMYSGSAQTSRRSQFNQQQETLVTLAGDTGGKALLDNNDLSVGIQQAQRDIASYYILGYYSTNNELDGRFRSIKVKLNHDKLQAKLNYRSGYFAGKQFGKFTSSEKERQLEEAILLGDPMTELPLALEVNYFRIGKATYFVPVAVKIAGSALDLAKKGSEERAELDFIAQVRDGMGRMVGTVRDGITVKLKGEDAGGLTRRNLEYDTGFTLGPGDYSIKFLARENVTGKMGAFETKFTVPDTGAKSQWLRTSSVVWANQRESLSAAVGSAEKNKKLIANHPLIQDGQKLIPSITRVYRRDQSLYVYLEVYDPGVTADKKAPDILASLSFFKGSLKAFETEAVRVQSAAAAKNNSVPVRFEIPLSALQPGEYNCQVSLVDGVGQKFTFARAPMVLL